MYVILRIVFKCFLDIRESAESLWYIANFKLTFGFRIYHAYLLITAKKKILFLKQRHILITINLV